MAKKTIKPKKKSHGTQVRVGGLQAVMDKVEKSQMRADLGTFKPGDTIRVHVRIKEGEKERIQNFKGIVISRRGMGISQSFLIRKISNGVGVERVFPLFSPMIQGITVIREGKVRRAKLYYLRGMSERKIRQKTT